MISWICHQRVRLRQRNCDTRRSTRTRGWPVHVFTSRCVAVHFLPFFSSSFSEKQCYSLFVRVIVLQKGKKAGRTVSIGWRTRCTRWPASFFFFSDIKSRKKPRDETTSPFLTPSILYLCWLRCRVLSPVLLSSSSFTFTWFFLVVCYWNCCTKLFLSFRFLFSFYLQIVENFLSIVAIFKRKYAQGAAPNKSRYIINTYYT